MFRKPMNPLGRLFSFVLLAFLLIQSQALLSQEVHFGQMQEAEESSFSPEIIHEDESYLYVLYRKDNNTIFLSKLEKQTGVQVSVAALSLNDFPKTNEMIDSYRVIDGRLEYIVLYDKYKENTLDIYLHSLDLSSGKEISNKIIYNRPYEKLMRKGMFKFHYSENKERMMIFDLYYPKGSRDSKLRAVVFSQNYEEYQTIDLEESKSFRASGLANVHLEADGSIFYLSSLGFAYRNAAKNYEFEEPAFPTKAISSSSKPFVIDFEISSSGNPLLLVGYKLDYKDLNYSHINDYLKRKRSKKQVEGIVQLEYNMNNNEWLIVSTNPLAEGSLAMFDYILPKGINPNAVPTFRQDPEIGTGNDYRKYVDSSGNRIYAASFVSKDYMVNQGTNLAVKVNNISLFAVSPNGKLLWLETLPHEVFYPNVPQLKLPAFDDPLDFKWVEGGSGELMLVYNDHEDNTQQIGNSREISHLRSFSKDEIKNALPFTLEMNLKDGSSVKTIHPELSKEDYLMNITSLYFSELDQCYYYFISNDEAFQLVKKVF